jgi:hypothetical protein
MQTLRRERKQKFTKIIAVWIRDSPAILEINQDVLILEEEIVKLAVLLADAATSDGERRTDEEKRPYLAGIEASIFSGRPTTQEDIDATNGNQQTALDAFQIALQTPLNWNWYPAKTTDEKTWRDFRKFICDEYAKDNKCFAKYQTWRTQPYSRGAMSNLAIKRNPENFPASWSDFLASDSGDGKQETATPTEIPDWKKRIEL